LSINHNSIIKRSILVLIGFIWLDEFDDNVFFSINMPEKIECDPFIYFLFDWFLFY
jgi:hypothetical protein